MTLQWARAVAKGQCRYKSVLRSNKRAGQVETWLSSLFALTFWVASSDSRVGCVVVVVCAVLVVVVVKPCCPYCVVIAGCSP